MQNEDTHVQEGNYLKYFIEINFTNPVCIRALGRDLRTSFQGACRTALELLKLAECIRELGEIF